MLETKEDEGDGDEIQVGSLQEPGPKERRWKADHEDWQKKRRRSRKLDL